MRAYIHAHRTTDAPFDVVIGGQSGVSRAADRAAVEAYAQAGATWWLEDASPWAFGWQWHGPWPFDAMRERIRQGPPAG
jgi:hypothetical protein